MPGREAWGLVMESDWVIELDSSSPAKFSRHVIIRVPGAAFEDALSAGGFCSMVLKQPGLVVPLGSPLRGFFPNDRGAIVLRLLPVTLRAIALLPAVYILLSCRTEPLAHQKVSPVGRSCFALFSSPAQCRRCTILEFPNVRHRDSAQLFLARASYSMSVNIRW